MATVNPIAAAYARQSHGKAKSIEEQMGECLRACEQEGWQVGERYTDKVSASRFTRSGRDDWPRLIADLEAGKFGVLVMWESSRGDRDLETWAGLLRRCRERGVLIHVVSHDHTYDMRRARDWRTLADEGVGNAYESEQISGRVRRGMTAAALAGRPHGPVHYGYRRIYDEKTRELVRQEPHPAEAAVIQEIISRLGQGEPVKTVTDSLNERGIPSMHGLEWSRSALRRMALNPVYIGKRQWQGHQIDGDWPPLVSEADYRRAERFLNDPERKTTKPTLQRHLLSYFAVCDVCGKPLEAFRQGGRAQTYACSARGCVYISCRLADEFTAGLVAARIDNDAFWKAMESRDDEAVLAARAEADGLQARLDDAARAVARDKMSQRAYLIMEAELLPQIRAAEKRAAEAVVPVVLHGLPHAFGLLREFMLDPEVPVSRRRDVIRALVQEIRIAKASRKGPRPPEETIKRIKIIWRQPKEN